MSAPPLKYGFEDAVKDICVAASGIAGAVGEAAAEEFEHQVRRALGRYSNSLMNGDGG